MHKHGNRQATRILPATDKDSMQTENNSYRIVVVVDGRGGDIHNRKRDKKRELARRITRRLEVAAGEIVAEECSEDNGYGEPVATFSAAPPARGRYQFTVVVSDMPKPFGADPTEWRKLHPLLPDTLS